jgi:hypothetical protein
MYSEVYKISDDSFHAYNGASTDPPTYSSPVTASVSCSLSISQIEQLVPLDFQSLLPSSDAWVGAVLWITQPLAENLTIQGTVTMTVWMNALQSEVAGSAYLFGMAESDSAANFVSEPTYQYHQSSGSVLGTSLSSYQLGFTVDHTFAKGNLIAFLVAVEATTQGWRYQVYFDSPSTNSNVMLPILQVPIPEFSQTTALVSMTIAVLVSFIACRRRK